MGREKINPCRILCLLLFLLPPLSSLAYLYLYGVNVPYLDDWELVPLFEKISVGRLSLSDLFAPHNEHMIFFPRLLMLSLGILSRFNICLELFVNWLFAVGTALLVLHAFKREAGKKFFWAAIPLSFLLFNWKQFSLLEGFNIAHHMSQFFSVLTLYLLALTVRAEHPWKPFLLALGSATIASLSALSGMLAWPVGCLILLCQEKRVQKNLTFFWVTASLTLYLYYLTLIRGNFHPHALPHFAQLLTFALKLLGTSLYLPSLTALLGFLLILLAFAGALLSKLSPFDNPFWLSLTLYALLVAAAITLGRSSDPSASGWQHYTIYTLLAPAGLYGLFFSLTLSREARAPQYLFYFTLLLLLASIPEDLLISVRIGRIIREERLAISYTLLSKNPSPYLLKATYPNPEKVKKRVLVLKKLQYSLFSPAMKKAFQHFKQDRKPP